MKDPAGLEIFRLGTSGKYGGSGGSTGGSGGGSDCGDWCEVSIATVEPRISNIYLSHRGCLLSKACLNAVAETIENRTRDEALEILYSFRRMLSLSAVPEDLPEALKLFGKFAKFPSRRGCLLLGCDLIIKELNGGGKGR